MGVILIEENVDFLTNGRIQLQNRKDLMTLRKIVRNVSRVVKLVADRKELSNF